MKQKLLFFMIALSMTVSSFSQTLDQNNSVYPVNRSSVFTDTPSEILGQSFTAGLTGTLSKFSFYFNDPAATTYVLQIYNGSGNTGTLLGTQTFTIPTNTPSGEFQIEITSNINIIAGNVYTAYVTKEDLNGNVELSFGERNTYLNGSSYIGATVSGNGTNDFMFKTYVTQPATHLNFDGVDDYVEIPNNDVFNVNSSLSVELWMNSSTNTFPNNGPKIRYNDSEADKKVAYPNNSILVKKGDSGWGLALNTDGGTVVFSGPGGFVSINSRTIVTDGKWHHIAGTFISDWEGTFANLYIDGVLEASTSVYVNGQISANNSPLTIGSNYQGDIDDVRIWNVARTAAEINSSKDCSLLGTETGLLAYYKFNQGNGGEDNSSITTLTDSKGTNNGTFNGFTLNGSTSNFLAGNNSLSNISYTYTKNNVSCNGTSDGSIIVTATGGKAPYTFSWSNGSQNGTISGLSPATYTLHSITDANGCVIGNSNPGGFGGGNSLENITIEALSLGNPTVTTPVNYTQGDIAETLKATIGANGTGLLWYTAATGGTAIETPTPNTDNIADTSYWVTTTNANGCESDRVEIVVKVSSTLSVSNLELEAKIKIYPNPASNNVTIETPQLTNVHLQVIDTTGKEVLNRTLDANLNSVDVSKLPSGLYLFKISSNEGTTTSKIIKQ